MQNKQTGVAKRNRKHGGQVLRDIALKKIFGILIEKLARLDIVYEKKLAINDPANITFINECKNNLQEIKKDLCFAIESKNDIEKALGIYKSCMAKFLERHSLLAHLPANVIASETYIYLSEILKTKATFKEFDSRIVMLTQDFLTRNTHKYTSNLPFVSDLEKRPVALYMPILQSTNPLYWPILVKNAFSNVEALRANTKKNFEELIGCKDEIPEETRRIAEKLTFSLMSDLFSLKLLGPAYYYLFAEMGVFRSIAETRIRFWPTLAIREELLYNELVKMNLDKKAGKTHKWFLALSELSDELHTTLGFKVGLEELGEEFEELVARINREINNIYNEQALFNENDLNISICSMEKLKYGILIPSSKIEGEQKVCPNTPQQIINAGWIYREEVGEEILNIIIETNSTDYKPFIEDIKKLDGLLANSIEKSRITGMLLDED